MMTSSPPAPPGTNDQLSPVRSSRPASSGQLCDGGYQRGLTSRINDPSLSTTYVKVSESALTNVGTSWTLVESPWTSVAERDGHQLQVRAYGNAAGDYAVRFDNVRAEER
ncbi:MAG: hypothetical protein EOO27_37760 [Comamonadaceae bacterium]|nr:MAG: hypothetical protein EOO27_37760 [Comamonadaceae bacterium]